MKKIRNLKVAKKLLISYLIACVAPLLIVSTVIYNVSVRKLEESSLEFTSIFTSQIIANLNTFMDEYDRVTKSLLVDSEMISQISETEGDSVTEKLDRQLQVRRLMMRLQMMEPEIENSMFLTRNDMVYGFSQNGDNVNRDILLEQEWLKQMQESKETLTISAVHNKAYYDENQDGIVVTLGRKIMDYRGAYIGILLMDIDPSLIIDLSDGFLLARNQYNIKISIVDSYGGILYDSDVASGRLTWEEAAQDQNLLLYEKNEKDYIIFTEEAEKAGLYVNAVIPRSTLLLKIEKIGYVTGISVAVSVLTVILLSVMLSRGITRPIRDLQKQMKQVERGNYQTMVGRTSEDEIGELVASYNQMILQIKHLIEEVYEAQLKQKDAQYLALQTQINPHMLYNTLEAIRMKALVGGADEVADMIKILAKMFRAVLSSDQAHHTVQKEIDYAENYIRLQNIRYPGMFQFTVDLAEEIRESNLISMVLQPVIENCIAHGFRGRGTVLHIALTGYREEQGDIHLQITDDGKGLSEERAMEINRHIAGESTGRQQEGSGQEESDKKGNSIGLKNIADRIRIQYGQAYCLRIMPEEEQGTKVEICIPGNQETWRDSGDKSLD